MSNKSPEFPIFEPHHFSDYGFDTQFDYFQVLEEARQHKKETTKSIDLVHFKLEKPISKDDKGARKNRRWWWKNALVFFKSKWTTHHHHQRQKRSSPLDYHHGGVRPMSGPIYVTESISGSSTPCRTLTRPASGPIAGCLIPTRKGDLALPPYISLRDMNVDQQHGIPAPMPIYLVT